MTNTLHVTARWSFWLDLQPAVDVGAAPVHCPAAKDGIRDVRRVQ
jgi:hypothetical protein